jgi:hypothetical protein
MTDTPKTRPELVEDFSSGQEGSITAQTMRNFLISVPLISELSGYSGLGVSGYSGYSGHSGTGISGYSGISVSGYSGYSGYSGISVSGYSGYSGYSGISVSGYSGYSGFGVSGYSGFGVSGYSGYSGIGVSGYSGLGVSGYSGYSGAVSSGATSVMFTPANPTSFTGNTYKMLGLGSTIIFTPVATGIVKISISAQSTYGGSQTIAALYKVAYGTGAAPANGAVASGTVVGAIRNVPVVYAGFNLEYSWSTTVLITGLTLNTQIWIDLQQNSNSTLTACSCKNICCVVTELPY